MKTDFRGEVAALGPQAEAEVVIPGSHMTDDGLLEVGAPDFVEPAVRALPAELLYRRGRFVGTLDGDTGSRVFQESNPERLRILIDGNIRLVRWAKPRGKEQDPFKVYVPANRDHAALVREECRTSPHVRELDVLVHHPVFAGRGLELVMPGWNAAHELYYDQPADLRGLEPMRDPKKIRETLEDLVVDFPFKDEASKHNFFGLLITPIILPAMPDGNVPLHMIGSSLERTGKGKLAQETFGGVVLGHPAAAQVWAATEEERDKRITSLLKRAETIMVLDNLDTNHALDSAVLAALVTSRNYEGRILGKSEMPTFHHSLTIVATGNNVRCSAEIAKRTIPILLQPTDDHPEDRTNFRHPDVVEHVASVRRDVLAALLGMVELWKQRGRRQHRQPLGGFEQWSRTVGGILGACGFDQWRENVKEWLRSADPDTEDLRLFVQKWADAWPGEEKTTTELLGLVESLGVFPWVQTKKDSGRLVSFSRTVLQKHKDCPVDRWIIRSRGSGSTSLYSLEEQP